MHWNLDARQQVPPMQLPRNPLTRQYYLRQSETSSYRLSPASTEAAHLQSQEFISATSPLSPTKHIYSRNASCAVLLLTLAPTERHFSSSLQISKCESTRCPTHSTVLTMPCVTSSTVTSAASPSCASTIRRHDER